MECAFIADGYTLPGYLKGEPGMFPPVRFTWRICAPSERQAWFDFEDRQDKQPDADKASAAKSKRKLEIMAGHLHDWDLKDRKGEPTKPVAAYLGQLHPTQHDRLFNVILGVLACDPDPERPGEPDPNEAADTKNSPSG